MPLVLAPVVVPVIDLGVGATVGILAGLTSLLPDHPITQTLLQIQTELQTQTGTQTQQELERVLACYLTSVPDGNHYGCGCTDLETISDLIDDIETAQADLLDLIPSQPSANTCHALVEMMRRLLHVDEDPGSLFPPRLPMEGYDLTETIAEAVSGTMLCRSLDGTRHQKYCKALRWREVCITFASDAFDVSQEQIDNCTICANRVAFELVPMIPLFAGEFAILMMVYSRLNCGNTRRIQEIQGAFCDLVDALAALLSFGECPPECLETELQQRYVNIRC